MKLTIQRALVVLAVAAFGAGAMGTAYAQSSPAAAGASPASHNDRGADRGGRSGDRDGGGDRGYSRHDRGHFRHHHHRGHFRNYRAGLRHFRGGRGGQFARASGGAPFVGPLLRATRQLNLTSDQRTSLQAILKSARPTRQAGTQPAAQPQHPAMTVLGNPGDRATLRRCSAPKLLPAAGFRNNPNWQVRSTRY